MASAPKRIIVENERQAVAAIGLVAHEQIERQVEVMGQVDTLVAHHGPDLAAVVGVQRVFVAAVDVRGRAVEHQVGADDVGCRGIDAKLADLDRCGDGGRAVIVVGKQHPVAIGDGIRIGRNGDLQGVRVDMRELKTERPLFSIKGMRRVAELDEFELLDDVGIVERDRKRLALLQRFWGVGDHRTIGAQTAIGVEQVAGRINLRIEVRERPGSATASRENGAVGQERGCRVIEPANGSAGVVGPLPGGGVPDLGVVRLGCNIALVYRAEAIATTG